MPAQFCLTSKQLEIAETEAQRRQSHNEANGIRGRNNAPARGEKALAMHRTGCIGEVAVAYHLGMEDFLFLDASPTRNSRDLPQNIEVKTRTKHGYDLLIQLNDDPNKLYILTTYEKEANPYLVNIVGWTYGRNVMKKEFIREFVRGRPCYAIPQKYLFDIETITKELQSPDKFFRDLTEDEVWLTYDNDEIMLNLSQELITSLGWQTGDVLSWEIDNNTGTCLLRKKQ